MKKYLLILKGIIKDFFLNSFWKSIPILVIIFLSLALNVFLWYIFQTRVKSNPVPFYFASGIIGLNWILGNYLWEKEKLASYFLISTALFTQVLMLLLIRYLTMFSSI